VLPKGLDKLHSGEEWQRIRDEFFATGNAAGVQAGLTAVIDRLAMDAYTCDAGRRRIRTA
jgi:hypothetical protein